MANNQHQTFASSIRKWAAFLSSCFPRDIFRETKIHMKKKSFLNNPYVFSLPIWGQWPKHQCSGSMRNHRHILCSNSISPVLSHTPSMDISAFLLLQIHGSKFVSLLAWKKLQHAQNTPFVNGAIVMIFSELCKLSRLKVNSWKYKEKLIRYWGQSGILSRDKTFVQ